MKMLADENFPATVIVALRRRGHDVTAVTEAFPGVSDTRVLAAAVTDQRLLLTLDRDFGDLIFHHGNPAPAGVILFRLGGSDPQEDNRRMIQTLEQPEQWVGRFTTVTDTLIRSRAFPR